MPDPTPDPTTDLTTDPTTESIAEPIARLLAEEWHTIADLLADLTPDAWATPTDCPGWSVQDQVAHVIGTESFLAGHEGPPAAASTTDPAHVKNDIGRMNEVWVDAFRSSSPADVLARFRAVTGERIRQLRDFTPERFGEVGWSPVGNVPYREFMHVRLMDNWVHEQDIRRAVSRPGHRSGPIVEHALARFVPAMGFVVGKKAGAPDGSVVVFDLTGDAGRTVAVSVSDGKARVDAAAPATPPTVALTMDVETWWCLALGRWDGPFTRAAGLVTITGDRALGERIVDRLNFMV